MKKTDLRPKFSVLVTNYNYARFLAEAVESVLEQTVSDFEIIIVDDGSTDNSPAVIQELIRTDKRIHAFFQPNAGQAAAFNRAFAESKGKIICFLDADDLWMPEKLAWVERIFATSNDIALIQHNMYIIKDKDRSKLFCNCTLASGAVIDVMATKPEHYFLMPSSTMGILRKVLEKVMPMPPQLRICSDAYLYRVVLAHGKLLSLDLPLAYYRVHGKNNWTANPGRNDNFVSDEVLPLVLDYYRRCGIKNVATGKRTVSSESAMIARIVHDRMVQLKDRYPRIAIYGAGAHTRWLLQLLTKCEACPEQIPAIVAVLDDHPGHCEAVANLAVQSVEDVRPGLFDAIILSTDCFQDPMRLRLQQIFKGASPEIIDLYEGLPPGPYNKIAPDDFAALQQKPEPSAPERENAITRQLVVGKLRAIAARHPRIAVYGDPGHVKWLTHFLKIAQRHSSPELPRAVMVLDDNPNALSLGDVALPVVSPFAADPGTFDAILIAAGSKHREARKRLNFIFQPSPPPIFSLDEGLPEGTSATFAFS